MATKSKAKPDFSGAAILAAAKEAPEIVAEPAPEPKPKKAPKEPTWSTVEAAHLAVIEQVLDTPGVRIVGTPKRGTVSLLDAGWTCFVVDIEDTSDKDEVLDNPVLWAILALQDIQRTLVVPGAQVGPRVQRVRIACFW